MEIYRWFWAILTLLVVAWYSVVTLAVAFHGVSDIRKMLRRLSANSSEL